MTTDATLPKTSRRFQLRCAATNHPVPWVITGCCTENGTWVSIFLVLYSKALVEPFPDELRQAAGCSIPLIGGHQGLLVQLHHLGHLIVQAVVQEASPGSEGLAQHGKAGQSALQERQKPLEDRLSTAGVLMWYCKGSAGLKESVEPTHVPCTQSALS